MPKRLAHDLGQLRRRRKRPGGDNRAGYAARLALLAIAEQDIGNLAFRRRVQKIRRGRAASIHAHVERPLGGEGKAAQGLVQLHR